MAYDAITTLADAGVLGAGHVTNLQQNALFLYNITVHANNVCPQVHRNVTGGFGDGNHIYKLRQRGQYLRFEVIAVTGTLNYVRLYYDSVRVYANETPGTTVTDSVDLYDMASWSAYGGAWATATSYNEDGAESMIVSHGGAFYRVTADHTSGSITEPGVGANWATVWILWNGPATGGWYDLYFESDYISGTGELALQYVFADYEAA